MTLGSLINKISVTKHRVLKDISVESVAFWLIVSALIIVFTSFPIKDAISASGLVFAVVYVIVAFFSLRLKRIAFISALILALFTVAGTAVLDFSSTAEGSPFLFMSQQAYLFIPQFLIMFYSFRAFRQISGKNASTDHIKT